jgi:hypothetical protein
VNGVEPPVDPTGKNTEADLCAVQDATEFFPPNYVGKVGDVLRPWVFIGLTPETRPNLLELHCSWPVGNSGFRLAVVIAGLLGSALFGVTLSSDKSKTAQLKWFLGALAILATVVCAVDSQRVGYVAARSVSDANAFFVFNSKNWFLSRFIAVCVLDIVCALEAVRVRVMPLP